MKREAGADGAAEGECELLASDKRLHLTTEQGAQGTIPDELCIAEQYPGSLSWTVHPAAGRTGPPPTANAVSNEMR